ncbi:hypothetical protein GCM10007173_02900 [Glutamicibacter ardleyensis]|uniref:Uncharacterized protein n=1 Tax=Glutamicibacter ardleyensis TaxID=225894 RepID=A0ABQ2D6F9_9MICC|nr:hypothetical protein GCM10007173_02900 [Glutamicibacter ardleyensis]
MDYSHLEDNSQLNPDASAIHGFEFMKYEFRPQNFIKDLFDKHFLQDNETVTLLIGTHHLD